MVRRPFELRLLLELRSVLKNLRPPLLAILKEEACVELDAAGDLKFGSLTMLVADLCGPISKALGISISSQHVGGPDCFSHPDGRREAMTSQPALTSYGVPLQSTNSILCESARQALNESKVKSVDNSIRYLHFNLHIYCCLRQPFRGSASAIPRLAPPSRSFPPRAIAL
jgi:hypothetical protein